jgi:ribosomal protein S12 methylthiotransferase accessory factor
MVTNQPSNDAGDVIYSLVPDLDVIPMGNDEWLCQSATRASRIGGPLARLLIERVLPLLDHERTGQDLAAALPNLEPSKLRRTLDALVTSGILRSALVSPPDSVPALAPLLILLDTLQIPVSTALARLAEAHIVIIGLEGVGAHLALLLTRCGLKHLTLVDPYPCQPGNLPLLPVGNPAAVGQTRQELLANSLREQNLATQPLDLTVGPDLLTAENVEALVTGRDCVVSCFDRGFGALHHWVNRASLRSGVPALYTEALGHQGWAGPLVLPGQTACYMCYRMRRVACATDSVAALAYEEHLDQQTLPRLHTRAVLPALMPHLAGVLATTLLQVILGLQQPGLAGRVLEYAALTLQTAVHPVLQQPECPACGPPKKGDLLHPILPDLLATGDQAGDILQIAEHLVSPQTGIIREVQWYEKGAAEPVLPYICQVTLANHLFQAEPSPDDLTCWGKGLTPAEAQASGLGEAIERYAGGRVDPRAIVYARRSELDGASLDPRDLVLYRPEQYTRLPYQPYQETSMLGWIQGRSLVSGERVYLPALAAFMDYQARHPSEYLFPVTSNGLAAGVSLTQAILAATYEVIERDAFMITWFGRLPTRRVDPLTHPEVAIRALCRAYQRRGIDLGLWQLPTDHPCTVFLALGLQEPGSMGPAVIAGLGADLTPARAARKAILEVGQIHPSYRRSLRRPAVQEKLAILVADPHRVTDMHDHGLLYCSPAMLPALNFLLDRTPERGNWPPESMGNSGQQLEQLVRYFRTGQADLLYYNLTSPDLARWGLYVVRVIVPGYQPIAFGAQEPRLGGRRLYELPQQLGLAPGHLQCRDLNPYPHPFD